MKKLGFTLAEVLITLAIIGVIATLTLPALMTNTAEQQAKAGIRKGINTLTEAAQTNLASAGFDYATAKEDSNFDKPDDQSFYGLLANRASVDFGKNITSATTKQLGVLGNGNSAVFLRDGSAIIFKLSDTKATEANAATQGDGLPLGYVVIYDTNGTKAPNIQSNCKGNQLPTAAITDDTGEVSTCTKDKRVIKDQFTVKLRGNYAQPVGAAARWAMED